MIAAKRFIAVNEVVYWYRVEYKSVDWLENNARKLNDHIVGCTEVLRIANKNGLAILAENIAKDVYGLIRPMKIPFGVFEPHMVLDFLDEIKLQLNANYSHKFQRIFGIGFRGFVERIKRCLTQEKEAL